MASSFDFGSGMPLPPAANSTSIYNSFQTYYNTSASYAQNSFDPPLQQAQAGHSHGFTSGFGVGNHQPQDYAQVKQERRDSARSSKVQDHQAEPSVRPSGQHMPKLFKRMDDELFDYLKSRRISPLFIHEIDQFLATHPELADLRPEWVKSLHDLRPLHAYRFFLKGYTRPARYRDDAFPYDMSTVKFPSVIYPLANAYDVELIDFFDGYNYRQDILELIDGQVAELVKRHEHGFRMSSVQYKLVCFVIWGQPVDAYKFFEYNYQTEWLAHRYLPEHVILHELPKPSDYCQPTASVIPPPNEDPRVMQTFCKVRLQMARAYDAGVDVVDVLMEEFIAELARRGFRRVEIDKLKRRAEKEVNHQRKISGTADIVDLVMGLSRQVQPSRVRRGRMPTVRRRTVNHRITEAKKDLQHVLSQDYKAQDHKVGLRRLAERELVLAVVAQATIDQSMSSSQAATLLALVPKGKKARSRREKAKGVPDIMRMLSAWL